jgi:hypothetical protein
VHFHYDINAQYQRSVMVNMNSLMNRFFVIEGTEIWLLNTRYIDTVGTILPYVVEALH